MCACFLCNTVINNTIYKAYDCNFCSNKCRNEILETYTYTINYKLKLKDNKLISSYNNTSYNKPINNSLTNNSLTNNSLTNNSLTNNSLTNNSLSNHNNYINNYDDDNSDYFMYPDDNSAYFMYPVDKKIFINICIEYSTKNGILCNKAILTTSICKYVSKCFYLFTNYI